MKKNLSILCIMLTGLSSVHSQANETKSLVEKMETIPSQTLVDALVNRIPSARKITDRYGNKNISLRGRQSFKTAGDAVLWDIDGIIYPNPPILNVNQVQYVEVLNGLAATNKYGSEGGAGVIVVKTIVNSEKINSSRNVLKPKKAKPKKKKKKKKKKN